jgi:hypothetical protein
MYKLHTRNNIPRRLTDKYDRATEAEETCVDLNIIFYISRQEKYMKFVIALDCIEEWFVSLL